MISHAREGRPKKDCLSRFRCRNPLHPARLVTQRPGKLNKLTLKVERPELTPADIKRLEEMERAKAIQD